MAAFKSLLEEAMALPEAQRAELAALLLRSLEPDDEPELSDDEWQQAWSAEIERRLRSIDDGSAKAVDGDEVLRSIRARIAAAKS
jgi:putative addiction module component (TIGR02574 family)